MHSRTVSDSGAVSVRRHRRACLQLLLQLGLRRDELLGAGAPAADSLLQLLRASRCGFNSESRSGTHMKRWGGRGLRAGGSALTCSAARVATSSSRSCCAESIDHESGPSATVSHPADDIRSESDASRFCAASRSSWAAASPSLASVCARLSLAFSAVSRSSSSCCGVGPGAGAGAALFLLDLTSRCGTTTVRSGRKAIRTRRKFGAVFKPSSLVDRTRLNLCSRHGGKLDFRRPRRQNLQATCGWPAWR